MYVITIYPGLITAVSVVGVLLIILVVVIVVAIALAPVLAPMILKSLGYTREKKKKPSVSYEMVC